MPSESSFHPEKSSKPSILLLDGQILQEAKDKFSSLPEEDYDSIVSKSSMI